jgi:hypothetical protein
MILEEKIMNKNLSIMGIFLILLAAIANADLVFSPTSVDFGSTNQNESSDVLITIENPDLTDVTNVVISETNFAYSNAFIGTYTFDGLVGFSPNDFNITGNTSESVTATVNVPLSTRMGQYESVFTVTYNGTTTQDIAATVLVNQYTGRAGDLNILDTDSYDDVPDQMRSGNTLEIDLDVENDGSEDLTNVNLEVWLYDETLKQIVAFDASGEQTIDDGQDESFSVSFEISESLDEDHNYDLYIKTYKTDDELNHHEVKVKDFDLLDESDLCDVGHLDIDDFDVDDDEYTQGDTIQIDVDIENTDNDDIKDVIVEVWITEQGETKKLEKEKSSATDIDEDETESFSFEIEIDDDWDDGDYEIHVQAYEDDEEDTNCIEAVEEIEIDRPDHKVIIEDILVIPTTINCESLFTAEVDIQNVGNRDDDAVKVRMYNSDLGIDVYSDTFDLERYDDDDDTTVFLEATIPEGSENKEYTLTFTLYYDDLDEQKNYVEKITVNGCRVSEEILDETNLVTGEDEDGTVFLPTGWATSEFFGSESAKTVFWIVGDLALIVIIIYFLTKFFKKGK